MNKLRQVDCLKFNLQHKKNVRRYYLYMYIHINLNYRVDLLQNLQLSFVNKRKTLNQQVRVFFIERDTLA